MCDDCESDYSNSNASGSESESDDGFEHCSGGQCSRARRQSLLPFDPASLQDIILRISDIFDFRVVMSDGRVRNALMITTGLSMAGALVGKHYGGNLGAALGGAVGGACGVGIASVAFRDIWEDMKAKLSDLYDIAYDFLAGMNLEDYQSAAQLLLQDVDYSTNLAQTLANAASSILKKKITSTLTQ